MSNPTFDGRSTTRPFAGFALTQIDQHMTDCWDDPTQLGQLAEELGHRGRASAKRLRARIVDRIVELGGEPPLDQREREAAQIEELRTRIGELERTIADLQEQLAAKDRAISALQTDSLF